MTYDNTNRGQIWKNDKEGNESRPDFKGSINVEGVEYWVSAWKRKEGAHPKAPALAFSIQPKEQSSEGSNALQVNSESSQGQDKPGDPFDESDFVPF